MPFQYTNTYCFFLFFLKVGGKLYPSFVWHSFANEACEMLKKAVLADNQPV